MKKTKKITSLLLCLVLAFMCVTPLGNIEASAASYPTAMASNSVMTAYIGDNIPLHFKYFPAYNNEKMEVNIYGPNGYKVASTTFEFSNKYSNYGSFTAYWDTEGDEAGRYKVEVVKHFYSLYQWNTAPTTSTAYVYLEKPSTKPMLKNNYSGSNTYFSESVNKNVTAKSKYASKAVSAWKVVNVNNVSNPYSIQLNEMYIGAEAQEIALENNMYNPKNLSNCQWVLLKFNITNNGYELLEAGDLVDWTNTYLSNSKKSTLISTCTFDEPGYNVEIAPGETKEAWFGFYVLKSQGLPFIKLSNDAFVNINPKYIDTDFNAPAEYKLSTTEYKYNGKEKKPSVKVYGTNGGKISSKYYTVKYESGRKKVGKYKVTINFKGDYAGTKNLYFTIEPKGTSVSSLSASKKSLKVKIKKQSSQTTGYQIAYSTSKTFKAKYTKIKTISSYKTTSYTLKSLKGNKTYYVKVRTYKTVNGKKYYSDWSSYKTKKTK